MLENIIRYLKMKDVEYKEDLKMDSLTSIKIGGMAALTVYPKSATEIKNLLDLINKTNIKHKIIGRMSNILPCDEKYEGVLIKTDRLRGITVKGNSLIAYVGEGLPTLSRVAALYSLSGLEELAGIPGSLGGALYGNAGAYGRSISDITESCEIYDIRENRIRNIEKNELEFSYRDSVFKRSGFLIISVKLTLASGSSDNIFARIREYKEKRLAAQPTEPSLGSIFKRHGDSPVSRLIDLLGLKGTRIGGAEISQKHAGFIVNRGGATSQDVKSLISFTEKKILSEYSIKLEREIEYL